MISHREGNGDRAVCLAKTVPVDPCADHFCRDPLGVKAAEHLALLSESICQSASALTTERVDKLVSTYESRHTPSALACRTFGLDSAHALLIPVV